MKQPIFVASVISDIRLPKQELENAANKYYYNRHTTEREEFVTDGYENISWRFLNISVKGNVQIVFGSHQSSEILCAEIPIKANFIAICIKPSSATFELEFAISLS